MFIYLYEVLDESEVSLLQLGPGQSGQRVGVVKLFSVVRREQVWVQSDYMSRVWGDKTEDITKNKFREKC